MFFLIIIIIYHPNSQDSLEARMGQPYLTYTVTEIFASPQFTVALYWSLLLKNVTLARLLIQTGMWLVATIRLI